MFLLVELRSDEPLCLALLRGESRGLAALASRGDLLAQYAQQLRIRPRLFDKVNAATLQSFDGNADRGPAGHNHDGRSTVNFFKVREQVEPFPAGSRVARVVQVHQQKVELALAHSVKKSRRRGYRLGRVTLALQEHAERTQHIGLIVGDQDARLSGLRLGRHAGLHNNH